MDTRTARIIALTTATAATAGCATERVLIDETRGAGHTIGSLSFSADGERLAFSVGDWSGEATVADSGTIRVADSAGGNVREIELDGCSVGNVYHLAFANRSQRIAYASRDSIHILKPSHAGWKDQAIMSGAVRCDDSTRHGAEVRSLAWSPDDSRIAFSTLDRQVGILEIASGSREMVFDTTMPAQILAWTADEILVKDALHVIAIDIDARRAHVVSQLDGDVDFVSVTRRGRIYAVHDGGSVSELDGDGVERQVLRVQPRLLGRMKLASHWFRVRVSPRDRYMAVAEGAAERVGEGRTRLSIVKLPPPPGKGSRR